MNIPNTISLARFLAAPVIVWLVLSGQMAAAFWLFLAASVSDAVDGLIAKRFGASTVLGGYLDPLADKALLVGVYVVLGVEGHIVLWLVILVAFRDMLIVGGALLFQVLIGTLSINPLMISKVNTVTQVVLAAVVLARFGFDLAVDEVVDEVIAALVIVVAATTLASGGAYVVGWTRRAARVESPD